MGVAMVVIVVVGMRVGHEGMLYYNITRVHIWTAARKNYGDSGRNAKVQRGRPDIVRRPHPYPVVPDPDRL